MKKIFTAFTVMAAFNLQAQVTQINSNRSLLPSYPLSSTKTILVSDIDSSLWVSDATLAGTVQISATIKYEEPAGILSGKLIFRGRVGNNGSELYSTDGTIAGTSLVKDIYSGVPGSNPTDFTVMNNTIYFSAVTLAEGRELWKTNGTNAGTTLVKDIAVGPGSSNREYFYEMFSNGSYVLFAANTAAEGLELWKTDGTSGGTVLLKNINSGADSSSPQNFYKLNNLILFTAKDATHGDELWKTDGTAGGTVLLKDINAGTENSTTFSFFGFDFPIFDGFLLFKNKGYFRASDGNGNGQLWSTDGTAANTTLLKDVVPGMGFPYMSTLNAVVLPDKFIFSVSDAVSTSELWQSNGTPAGTSLFKEFSAVNSDIPFIMPNYQYDVNTGSFTTSLFQGNKFFFTASTDAEGKELWISDGTLPNTKMVKNINAGANDGVEFASYAFTTDTLYFAATDGIKGNELWKTDGTDANTKLVADINTGLGDSGPELTFFTANGKLIFNANNGDNTEVDLYVLGGTIVPPASSPCPGTAFSITSSITGALYQWQANTGTGFTNISNGGVYGGATTPTLLITAPTSFYGYQYRCNVAGNFSSVTTLKFVNTWKGAVNNLWNNAANWSCNTVPDANTDVIINTGTAVLNVNGSCRSITVSAGASFTANTGFTLQVTH